MPPLLKRKLIRTGALALAGALLVGAFICQPYRLLRNVTASMPIGWYLLDKSERPGVFPVGTAIAYYPRIPGWAEGRYPWREDRLLIKRIGAGPGDVLHTVGMTDYRCPNRSAAAHPERACQRLGTKLSRDSDGRPIPDVPRWDRFRLPEGRYYMYGDGLEHSFDSRYQGLIAYERIAGTIRRLGE